MRRGRPRTTVRRSTGRVKDVSTGGELGRWTLDNPVLYLEFAESRPMAGESDPEALSEGIGQQIALVAINRVETRTHGVLLS